MGSSNFNNSHLAASFSEAPPLWQLLPDYQLRSRAPLIKIQFLSTPTQTKCKQSPFRIFCHNILDISQMEFFEQLEAVWLCA